MESRFSRSARVGDSMVGSGMTGLLSPYSLFIRFKYCALDDRCQGENQAAGLRPPATAEKPKARATAQDFTAKYAKDAKGPGIQVIAPPPAEAGLNNL